MHFLIKTAKFLFKYTVHYFVLNFVLLDLQFSLYYSINTVKGNQTKALGKLGNIVAETSCFLSMFPCLPTSGNMVAETKFAFHEATFPNKFRNIFVAETMFPGLPTCFQMFPARETLFSRLGALKHCFKTIVQT